MFFYSIVTHAIDVLTALIKKIREQFKRIATLLNKKDNAESAENIKSVPVVESSTKETESAFVQAKKDVVNVPQTPEPEEILFSASTKVPEVKAQQRTVTKLMEQKEVIPPRPEFNIGMEEYDKLQEIYRQLVKQENAVLTCEKEIEHLQQELLLCKGVFQGKRRKKLEGQIADKEYRIANMKQCLGDVVRGYGYSSIDDFMRVYHHAKADYADYTKRLKAWADKYSMKFVKQQYKEKQNSHRYDHEQTYKI
ncbi:MAG: hypothetical protein K2M46_12165 [Lachnospiraceae bacterium]|nr:hypothetical protein [Lachnospiraceae bacterium]